MAWLIPILAGLTQFFSTKLMSDNGSTDPDQPGAAMMNQMMVTMPLVSVFICFTLPAAIGLYWVVQGALTLVQQIIVNKRMDKVDVNELVAKNVEKMNKKRARQGLPPQKITNQAHTSTRSFEPDEQRRAERAAETMERNKKAMEESTAYYNNTARHGSIAAKANMVKAFDEKNAGAKSGGKKKK